MYSYIEFVQALLSLPKVDAALALDWYGTAFRFGFLFWLFEPRLQPSQWQTVWCLHFRHQTRCQHSTKMTHLNSITKWDPDPCISWSSFSSYDTAFKSLMSTSVSHQGQEHGYVGIYKLPMSSSLRNEGGSSRRTSPRSWRHWKCPFSGALFSEECVVFHWPLSTSWPSLHVRLSSDHQPAFPFQLTKARQAAGLL